jgi:hypothetical protein
MLSSFATLKDVAKFRNMPKSDCGGPVPVPFFDELDVKVQTLGDGGLQGQINTPSPTQIAAEQW